jgi:hypothetical protein
MISLMRAIEGATSLLEFASAVSEVGRDRSNRPHNPRVRELVRGLRGIYFTPRGTLTVIAELAEGRRPTDEDIEKILPEFNDGEWRVRNILDSFDFDEIAGVEISLRRSRLFGQIRMGKLNLRRDIQEALNEALTTGVKVNKRDARILLQRVTALNLLIESLEEELL